MPGALFVDRARTRLTTRASNGANVRVGSYTTATAATVDVPMTNSLTIGALDLTGTLTKTGLGMLAVGGSASAGADAALDATAG